ncbi:MAG TPA: hypothetical protein PKD61_05885 [Polyangiaceae bacterium]|nr:hypothetical protein [Polyangiaceae bacterium]
MDQANPPIRSFGRLAKLALAHEQWPGEVEVQPRSLAALFSRFDRDLELDWLNTRPGCEGVLSLVLGCALTDLRGAAHPNRIDDDATRRRMRFHDAPFARAFDFLDEPLPPGIPARVGQPSRWGRLWWHAPSGSGRSLAGRWLAARALAFVMTLDDTRSRGPAYLELAERLHEHRLEPWARDGICIAASFVPRDFVRVHGFEVIECPKTEEFLPELVRWMPERLPDDGHFDPGVALSWLEHLAPNGERQHSFGTVLGLCGLLDEQGSQAVTSRSRAQLLERFVRRKLLEARDRGSADAAWLSRHVEDVFMPFMARTLTDGRQSLSSPRSLEAWTDLVPEEHRRGPDLEWLRLSLSGVEQGVSLREIERAARRVPPGAFRILRALQAADILVETGDDLLVLRPHFLAKLAEQEALTQLISGSGFEWGEALLAPATQGRAFNACLERTRRSGDVRLDTSELGAEDSAAAMAALEAEARAVGLCIALGEAFEAEQVAALSDEARGLWIELADAPPLPRLAFDSADDSAPLHDGFYHLSMLAMSEQVYIEFGRRREGAPGPLAPWGSAAANSDPRVLDSIASAIDGAFQDTQLHAAALALVDRLRKNSGRDCSDKPWHRLEQPGVVMELAKAARLQWSDLAALSPRDLPALLPLAELSGVGAASFAQAAIAAAQSAGAVDFRGTLADPAAKNPLWGYATAQQLVPLLQWMHKESVDSAPLLKALPEVTLGELSARLSELPAGAQSALWRALPAKSARTLLDSASNLPAGGAAAAWEVAAPAVQRALRRWLFETPELAVDWLVAAPGHELERALEPLARVDRLDRLPEGSLHKLRAHLHAVVRQRPPEVRLVYAALARLEREAFPRAGASLR